MLVEHGSPTLIRRRQTLDDLLSSGILKHACQGFLIAFEGLDQSGKQTQAERLRAFVESRGRTAQLLDFPGLRDRHRPGDSPRAARRARVRGRTSCSCCTSRTATSGSRSSIARWPRGRSSFATATWRRASRTAKLRVSIPCGSPTRSDTFRPPALTILLDIAPETAARRKTADRDRYERDLALLSRVRESYHRQARQDGWLRLDGERDKDAVAADVITAVASRLAPP